MKTAIIGVGAMGGAIAEGMLHPQAPTRRATSGTDWRLPRSTYHTIQKSRDG